MTASYYNDPHIRSRFIEFLGGPTLDEATAMFVTSDRQSTGDRYDPRPTKDIWKFARPEAEIARSLWDRESLIAHIDIEYVNFDDSGEPFAHRARSFDLQRPVVRAVEELLLDCGIAPLHILSGRGHHFVWRIAHDSPAFISLAEIGHVPDPLMGKYRQPLPPNGIHIPPNLGRAFSGLGLALEWLSHRVLNAAGPSCSVPVQLTAVEVGPISHGREIISIDLSEYGDPLYTRTTRIPFSVYLKPLRESRMASNGAIRNLVPLFTIPLFEMDESQGLFIMDDREAVIELARRATVQIPDQAAGTCRLVSSYLRSRLARFHSQYYLAEHDCPESWPDGYDRTPLETLPLCVSRILQQPNDLLLRPAGIQHVVRTLLAKGWHPRHIAGLIRSKYERSFGWGERWYVYDATSRADFYVRLFAGLIADGLDPLIDFNCRSTVEKGYCCAPFCGEILEQCRLGLVERGQSLQHVLGPDHIEATATQQCAELEAGEPANSRSG